MILNTKYKIQDTKKGFTLIEMLAFLFIFSLITVTFYQVWSVGTQHIILVKSRLTASSLANEKMEVIRNLSFDDIALTTGSPSGYLVEEEDVTRNGKAFHVLTQIKKEDDPYDGIFPNDTVGGFVDYKSVKITISWDDGANSVVASSRFVPPGIEQPNPGDGVLVVNVSSDKNGGALVPQSTVRVRNSEIGFDETHSTDNFGHLLLVGLPESIGKYEITLTKSGWEEVSTYASFANGGPYNPPVHEHASVIAGALSPSGMFQNELANFTVKTVDYLGDNVANIGYHLKGGKKIGTDPATSEEVFNVNGDFETNSSGEKDHSSISPGEYEFVLTESGYEMIGISSSSPITIIPGSSETLTVKVSPKNVTALLVKVVDGAGGPVVSGAEIHLTSGSGYDETLTTGADGMGFFPVDEDPPPPFLDGTYDISISASGFDNYSGQVTVNAGELKMETIPISSTP